MSELPDHLDELWTLEVEKDGLGLLKRVSRAPNGKERVAQTNLRTQRLGELLMFLRAPLLEELCAQSMRSMDQAPPMVKRAVHELGLRPLVFWMDGYDEDFIAQWCREQGYDVQQ